MQIEASMPPILELLDYINDHKANAANHLHTHHPIAHCLPNPHRSHHITTEDGLPFQELHKPIGACMSTASKQQCQIKNAKCTNLIQIGQRIPTNTERIDKFAEPPWH